MLTVLSPAKKLDETRPSGDTALTEPLFAREARQLARVARALSVADLRRLMDISEPLARLNHARFAAFAARPQPEATHAAIRCFAGDTYAGLQAQTMSADSRHWAERHLRILSGLYGLLRPSDAIQAYRLEMGSKLATARGADLYEFWGNKIGKAVTALAAEADTGIVVNCASAEYFAAVQHKTLRLRVITPVFLDGDAGDARVISFWAKKARGAMARFMCDHHLTDPTDLRGFAAGGYAYRADLSNGDRLVFHRAAAAAA